MTQEIILRRGMAFSLPCPWFECKAPAGKPCLHEGKPYRGVCRFCKTRGAYSIHQARWRAAQAKPGIWWLACQAEGAPTDNWIARYEGDDHAFFCPRVQENSPD